MFSVFARPLLLLTVAWLLAACTILPSLNQIVPEMPGSIQDGLAAGRAGNHARMLTLCQNAMNTPGVDPLAFKCVAEAQAHLGNRLEAEAGYLTYLDRVPDDGAARLSLARLLLANNRHQPARHQMEKALAKEPKLAEAEYLLGESYRLQQQCHPAMQHYNRAIALDGGYAPALEGRTRAQREICKNMVH